MLVGAVQRLTGQGGDPVVQLQTNFGGGKTHSMLALYHLFSDVPQGDLAGIDEVLQERDVKAAQGQSRRLGRQQNFSRQSRNKTRWHSRPYALGRTGLATRVAPAE